MCWLASTNQQATGPGIWTPDLRSLMATRAMHTVAQWSDPPSHRGTDQQQPQENIYDEQIDCQHTLKPN